jgi:hypothetical protein
MDTRGVSEIGELVRVLDELLAPLAKRPARLALPVDPVDVLPEFLGRRGDRVPRLQQRLAGTLQVAWFRLLDQVDHVVQPVTFEAH